MLSFWHQQSNEMILFFIFEKRCKSIYTCFYLFIFNNSLEKVTSGHNTMSSIIIFILMFIRNIVIFGNRVSYAYRNDDNQQSYQVTCFYEINKSRNNIFIKFHYLIWMKIKSQHQRKCLNESFKYQRHIVQNLQKYRCYVSE